MSILLQNCTVNHLSSIYQFTSVVDVLRLDEIHPIISGNKWFKLSYYIQHAKADNKNTLLTFGGAYSNHIVATAAAAKANGLKSIGIIRGEKPATPSHTLIAAEGFGMELHFVSREAYKTKAVPSEISSHHHMNNLLLIPEGGCSLPGMKGAGEILSQTNTSSYTHFVTAVGTGTTLAGIASACLPHQKGIGVSALKNNLSLQKEIEDLLPASKKEQFLLLHHHHFGGYARHTKELISFMNDVYAKTGIPTDFVYTAKALYALFQLLENGFFCTNDKILFIHTGGLQGNLSLPKGTLIF